MLDLMKAYFQRPLSADEEAQLTRLLAQDEQAANRFAELARQDYEASGLPRPGAARHRRGLWVVGALLLGAGLAWAFWPAPAGRTAALTVEREVDEFEAAPTPAPEAPRRAAPPAPAAPAAAPQPDRLQVHAQGGDYVLTLDTQRAGGASLELCTPQGQLLRVLYRGQLSAGQTAFRWDRGGADGRPLMPGRYKLLLRRAGGATLSRTVDVSAR